MQHKNNKLDFLLKNGCETYGKNIILIVYIYEYAFGIRYFATSLRGLIKGG